MDRRPRKVSKSLGKRSSTLVFVKHNLGTINRAAKSIGVLSNKQPLDSKPTQTIRPETPSSTGLKDQVSEYGKPPCIIVFNAAWPNLGLWLALNHKSTRTMQPQPGNGKRAFYPKPLNAPLRMRVFPGCVSPCKSSLKCARQRHKQHCR